MAQSKILSGIKKAFGMGTSSALQASGFTHNYTDPNTGMTINGAWLQIRQVNYAPYQSVLVVVDVYQDQAAKQSGMSPVFYNVFPAIQFSDEAWATYFDPDVMDVSGHNIQKQALDYLEATI